ncbi:TBC1 domain family member 12-like isoform X4 [Perca fluviatilis]|uniref:TBC1 domain family member 12-like isoform X4 n=1 Tax=Perca fluviatilis TaxID=8168 RepID=UPI00196297BE|nr:TBC1 domain family member 12-like isoform X4 [Perca fluviatilis]
MDRSKDASCSPATVNNGAEDLAACSSLCPGSDHGPIGRFCEDQGAGLSPREDDEDEEEEARTDVIGSDVAAQRWSEEEEGDDDAFTGGGARHRNTFACRRRRQSAPGDLQPDEPEPEPEPEPDPESELQSRRPDIAEYFSCRKQRCVSQSVPGWKLFGKVPPKQSPSKQPRIIQQEFEARQVAARCSPTHNAVGQQSRRKAEPLSTTALILQDRPPDLPAKSAEETQRHRQQYEQMVAAAKRRELAAAERRQQQMTQRFRQEVEISNATLVWNQHILPHWDAMRDSRRARDLWWGGLPPSVRGRVWSLAIANELNITAELYEIFLSRAKEKWTNLSDTDACFPSDGASLADSLEVIARDISGVLPSLGVFQKGGPYHDLLQSILGAYICYRPDVGYVQGMSSVAAMLILNMDEVDVFISFSNLINRRCQLAFYRGQHQLVLCSLLLLSQPFYRGQHQLVLCSLLLLSQPFYRGQHQLVLCSLLLLSQPFYRGQHQLVLCSLLLLSQPFYRGQHQLVLCSLLLLSQPFYRGQHQLVLCSLLLLSQPFYRGQHQLVLCSLLLLYQPFYRGQHQLVLCSLLLLSQCLYRGQHQLVLCSLLLLSQPFYRGQHQLVLCSLLLLSQPFYRGQHQLVLCSLLLLSQPFYRGQHQLVLCSLLLLSQPFYRVQHQLVLCSLLLLSQPFYRGQHQLVLCSLLLLSQPFYRGQHQLVLCSLLLLSQPFYRGQHQLVLCSLLLLSQPLYRGQHQLVLCSLLLLSQPFYRGQHQLVLCSLLLLSQPLYRGQHQLVLCSLLLLYQPFYRGQHQLVLCSLLLLSQPFYRGQHQLMLRYFGAFQVFLQESLPRLFLHFQSSGVTPDLYLLDWILSLYLKPLPLEVACRVWDLFFRDGEEFLFRTALGILKLHQDVLLHMDLISTAQFLSRPPDEELLSDRLFSCISATPMLSGNRTWSQVFSSWSDSETNS